MPGRTLTRKLIDAHLVEGEPTPGEEIALRIDQTLTQDATGTLVMQELEAIGLDRARTDVSVQYVDHNLLQADERNAEDHEFLRSAARASACGSPSRATACRIPRTCSASACPARRWSGSDSHTCAAGSLGMLAIGVGGLEVAMAIAGEPLHARMPEVWGVRLRGQLPDGCRPRTCARDVAPPRRRRRRAPGDRVLRARACAASPRWTAT